MGSISYSSPCTSAGNIKYLNIYTLHLNIHQHITHQETLMTDISDNIDKKNMDIEMKSYDET